MMRFKAVLFAAATAVATPAAATPADPFDLPLPPEAPVTIGAMDRLTSVLAAKLAGPAALHPRLPKKEVEALAAYNPPHAGYRARFARISASCRRRAR